jgi:hypothetical protein
MPRRIVLYEEAFVNSEPHLDAEALAAWAEDRLSAAEREALEGHAADCERCQALLAAMVRTEAGLTGPALSERSESKWFRRISPLGWALPLTAAAAALIWLVASPVMNREPKVVETTAQLSLESPSPVPAATPLQAPSPVLADELKAKPEKQDLARNKDARDKVQAGTPLSNALAGAAPAAALPAPAPAAPALQPPAEAAKAESRAAGAARGGLGDRMRTLNEEVTIVSQNAVPLPEIVSTNPASRWRITRTPGLLQHSTDGGATWEPQQTNFAVELTAGYSPQPSICWMVGRAGTVLLTTDNRTWRRVSFPEQADLVAVTATDKDTATVTTRDGAKFSTSDGGVTWDRERVQETPATPF